MGYGLPAAIAAKIARPEACVVCFAGDGDFQMTAPELGTAMQADARPIVLIVNNRSYGTIRMHQERHYPGRVSFTDLVNPDFVAIGARLRLSRRARDPHRGFPRRLRPGARLEDRRGARPRHLDRTADPAPDPQRDARSRLARVTPWPNSTAS